MTMQRYKKHFNPTSTFKILTAAIAGSFAVSAIAADPEIRPDDSWITINGKVTSTTPNTFLLDYGDGKIRVEMDDWDWFKEGKTILVGDYVTVNGIVDDGLYEAKTIEADSVYVEGLNTYFYASAADEESLNFNLVYPTSVAPNIEVTGEITEVNGHEFTVDMGKSDITVDTRKLSYNPLDNKGFQRLDTGDIVKVSGEMDYDVFEEKEIVADRIITLVQDIGKSSSMR